jgi:hypothetical protein
MNFTILDNQNGLFVVQAVDANGNVMSLPSDVSCVSSNPGNLVVGTSSAPGSFPVSGTGLGNDGTVTLTVTSALANISTVFTFVVSTSDIAVGFTATLINVTTNPPAAPSASPAVKAA